jgi:hypothetical protein
MGRRRNRSRSDFNPVAALIRTLPRLLLLVLVLIPAAEIAAEFVLPRIPEPRPIASQAMTDQQISLLYGEQDVASLREILSESRDLRDVVYAPFVDYRLKPFAGRHVTVGADGWRRTPNQAAEGAKVVLFGGGTVFGAGVSDRQTIASYLQDALNRAGVQASVANRGVPGWFSTQERVALAQMLAAGDIPALAVFVDGLEDLRRCAAPDNTAISDERIAKESLSGVKALAEHSSLMKLIRRLHPEEVKPDTKPAGCATDSDVEKALTRLSANRRVIRGMAKQFGFAVLFVQQPVSSYAYDNAKRAVPVSPAEMVPLVGVAKGYSRLADLRSGDHPQDEDLLWLADLEPSYGNAYLDTVNYSPLFNQAIAQALASRVMEARLLPMPIAPL